VYKHAVAVCWTQANKSRDLVEANLVVYSVTDRASFQYAQSCLQELRPAKRHNVVILVANKQDIVRNRVISEQGRFNDHTRLRAFLDPETGLQALRTLFLFLLLLLLVLRLISQPIVVRLRTRIGDNITHNRTVSDFQLKS